jgi:hypothetical protein
MAATFYRRNKRERDKETPQGILGLGIRKRRTLAPRVTIFPLERHFFRVFKKFIFTRLHSDAGGYIIIARK